VAGVENSSGPDLAGIFPRDVRTDSFNTWGKRNAVECFRIADETISARSRVLLIHMAESWLRLAHQAEKNLATDLVYETPPPQEHPVLQEQHQQVQSKVNGDGT
jgi:hypothetical protein